MLTRATSTPEEMKEGNELQTKFKLETFNGKVIGSGRLRPFDEVYGPFVKLVGTQSNRESAISAMLEGRDKTPYNPEVIAFLKALEFTTITRRAAEIYEMDANEVEPDPALMGPGGWRLRNGEVNESAPGSQATLDAQADPAAPAQGGGQSMPAALAAARANEARAQKVERAAYKTIDTIAALDAVEMPAPVKATTACASSIIAASFRSPIPAKSIGPCSLSVWYRAKRGSCRLDHARVTGSDGVSREKRHGIPQPRPVRPERLIGRTRLQQFWWTHRH
jgi:hypothetical protein